MTKKDYTAVAEVLAKSLEAAEALYGRVQRNVATAAVAHVACELADKFRCTDIKFDQKKFFDAAGLDEHGDPKRLTMNGVK